MVLPTVPMDGMVAVAVAIVSLGWGRLCRTVDRVSRQRR